MNSWFNRSDTWFVLALQLIKRSLQDFEKKISVLFMHKH
jgi:hypothetical protein